MLHIVPIEPLEERYSKQWARWWLNDLDRLHVRYTWWASESNPNPKVRVGEFLDVVDTNSSKMYQLRNLIQGIRQGDIVTGDTILFHDLWFPGLEALFYIRDGTGIDFKIAGLLHAGTYDANDFLARKGMARWAQGIERAWFNEVDQIFVATNYHSELLQRTRGVEASKIKVTGFPIYWEHHQDFGIGSNLPPNYREDIVVFPHRLAPEKQPHLFDQLAYRLTPLLPKSWRFVRTKDVCKTKNEYYSLLCRSKVAVSFALQETWGIAQQEAFFAGCMPIVPNRLSYPEMYPTYLFSYDGSVEDCARQVMWATENYDEIVKKDWFVHARQKLLESGAMAIQNIVEAL